MIFRAQANTSKTCAKVAFFVSLLGVSLPGAALGEEESNTVELQNGRSHPVTVYWLDGSRERELVVLDPGQKQVLEDLQEGNVLVFKEAGEVVDDYVASAEEEQKHIVPAPLRSQNSNVKVSLRAVNRTGRPVEALWVDYSGKEESYGTIHPGRSWGISTYSTHPWRFRISGRMIGVYVTDGTPTQTIDLCKGLAENHPGMRSRQFVGNKDVEYLCWLRTDQPNKPPRTASAPTSYLEAFGGKTLDVKKDIRLGYNILYMDPGDMLNRGLPKGSPYVTRPIDPTSRKYDIERGLLVPNDLYFEPSLVTREYRNRQIFFTESERQEGLSVNVGLKAGVDAGGKGGGSVGSTFGYNEERKKLEASSNASIMATRVGARFWLTQRKPLIKPDPAFVDYVRNMGTDYPDFKHFFEYYGTHYQLSTLYGGMASYETLISSSRMEDAFSSSLSFTNTASANVKGTSIERSVGFSTQNASKDTEGWENEESRTIIRGGKQGESYDNWGLDEDRHLVPIKTDLRPIYDLIWPETFGAAEPKDIAHIRSLRRKMKLAYEQYLERESRRVARTNASPRVFAIKVDSIRLSDEEDGGAGVELWGYTRLKGERRGKALSPNATVYAWRNYGRNLRDTLDNVDTVYQANGLFTGVAKTEALFAIMPRMKKTQSNGVTRWVPDYRLESIKLYPDGYFRDDDDGGENADDWLYHTAKDAKMTLADVVSAGGRKRGTSVKSAENLGKITISYTVREIKDVKFDQPYRTVDLPPFLNFDGLGKR